MATEAVRAISIAEYPRAGTSCLVLPVSVDLTLLHSAGKAYPWVRPASCPRCRGQRLWGHGYVPRYFDGEPGPLWMRRWRCPDCHAVHTARPHTHWRRFMAPWWLILVSLLQKHFQARWLSLLERQRQQYWNHGYRRQQQAAGGLAEIWALWEAGLIVATHSLSDRLVTMSPDAPYPRFAVTAGPPGDNVRGGGGHGRSGTSREDRAVPFLAHQPAVEQGEPRSGRPGAHDSGDHRP